MSGIGEQIIFTIVLCILMVWRGGMHVLILNMGLQKIDVQELN